MAESASNLCDRFHCIEPVRACQKSTLRLAKQVDPHDSIELTHPCFCRFGVALRATGPLSNVLGNTPGKPVLRMLNGQAVLVLHPSTLAAIKLVCLGRENLTRYCPQKFCVADKRKGSNSYREPHLPKR